MEGRIVVIGGGIIGTWAAYQLALRRQKVVLLEQFSLPTTRGSSCGQSLIFRANYPNLKLVEMVKDAEKEWKDLEQKTGETLLITSGRISIAEKGSEFITKSRQSMTAAQLPFEYLDEDAFEKKYPMIRYPGWEAILEHRAGILKAEKILQVLRAELLKMGGIIKDFCKVHKILAGKKTVTLETDAGPILAKTAIVCAGPWTQEFLGNLKIPLQVEAIAVCYWKEKVPGTYSLRNGFPNFSHQSPPIIYGVPAFEYENLVKIAFHSGQPATIEAPDRVSHDYHINYLKKYVSEHFPGLEPEPALVERCLYTWTPDKKFIIDRHPEHPNVILGAGFCGGGFKISPSAGKALALLALQKERELNFDIKDYRADRFSPSSRL